MKTLEDYDFLDPELQKCPYEFYDRLREEAPVYRDPDTGFYILTRYADLLEAKRNIHIFSNAVDVNNISRITPQEATEIYATGWERPHTLHRTDPPTHTRHRKVIDRTFSAARVRELAPYIDSIVSDLMDALPVDREVDFVSQFAIPLPCYVIADQLGVPREDALKLKLWSDALLDPAGMMIDEAREIECAHQVVEFQTYFAERIAERRAHPRDDILSDLSARMDGEEALTVPQLLNMLEQIVTGGNESTTGLLGSGLLMLIQHPDQERLLREDPSRIPGFVEEVLRMESPVQSNFRQVKEDTSLGGVDLPKGSLVLMRYGAVNRDEAKFKAAGVMDVCREGVRNHVAFGFGIHHCPGSLLARQEAASAFRELLKRYKAFELLTDYDDLKYHPTFFLRGLQRLPVRLVPH